jgi:hypothetical protein
MEGKWSGVQNRTLTFRCVHALESREQPWIWRPQALAHRWEQKMRSDPEE